MSVSVPADRHRGPGPAIPTPASRGVWEHIITTPEALQQWHRPHWFLGVTWGQLQPFQQDPEDRHSPSAWRAGTAQEGRGSCHSCSHTEEETEKWQSPHGSKGFIYYAHIQDAPGGLSEITGEHLMGDWNTSTAACT